VRPGADYRRSLGLLAYAKARSKHVKTKSGLMLGLGERVTEVLQVLDDLRRAECDVLTLGQYLQPTDRQLPVARFLSPGEFCDYLGRAERMGFRRVTAGPLVRSSYQGPTGV
jgi:lipoic acid synthetase